MARLSKHISISEEQVIKLEMVAIAVGDAASTPIQQKLVGDKEMTISRMNQLIGEGILKPVWVGGHELYEPILEMIAGKQPFKIKYQDVTGKTWGYTVKYAAIVPRMYRMERIRPYLDCWCEEGAESGNAEIPELSHNWSLRIDSDHYGSASIEVADGEWRSHLDYIDVRIEFRGGVAWGYEGDENDLQDSGAGEKRTILRRVTSSYWLMRELAPHIICHPGSVQILEPESLKNLMPDSLPRSS